MNDDLQLQHRVMAELEFEPGVDAAHIGVSARQGVVTLSGHVGSYAEKHAAELAARRVKGVTAVAQNIEIQFASDSKTSDDEVAGRILNIIGWHKTVPLDRITVKVEHGLVTLTGEVDWYVQKARVEADVRRLSGVKDVLNEIKVRLSLRAEAIRQEIVAALERNAAVDADEIVVAVAGPKVTLTGTVDAPGERDTAEHIAWMARGVSEVENRIQVAGYFSD